MTTMLDLANLAVQFWLITKFFYFLKRSNRIVVGLCVCVCVGGGRDCNPRVMFFFYIYHLNQHPFDP